MFISKPILISNVTAHIAAKLVGYSNEDREWSINNCTSFYDSDDTQLNTQETEVKCVFCFTVMLEFECVEILTRIWPLGLTGYLQSIWMINRE